MANIPDLRDTLMRDAIVAPHDPGNAKRFISEYEKRPVEDNDLQSIYLKLKYFHDPDKHKYLNRIGNLYLESRKPYLAALCFSSLSGFTLPNPRYTENLKESGIVCNRFRIGMPPGRRHSYPSSWEPTTEVPKSSKVSKVY